MILASTRTLPIADLVYMNMRQLAAIRAEKYERVRPLLMYSGHKLHHLFKNLTDLYLTSHPSMESYPRAWPHRKPAAIPLGYWFWVNRRQRLSFHYLLCDRKTTYRNILSWHRVIKLLHTIVSFGRCG